MYGRQGKIVRRTHEKINLSRKNCSSARGLTGSRLIFSLSLKKVFSSVASILFCFHARLRAARFFMFVGLILDAKPFIQWLDTKS